MGGSIAATSLWTTLLSNDVSPSNELMCYTFGSPKSISKHIAEYWKENVNHLSVEHKNDIIPNIPLHNELITLPNKLLIHDIPNNVKLEGFSFCKYHSVSLYKNIVENYVENQFGEKLNTT
jgi:hypothetical protein